MALHDIRYQHWDGRHRGLWSRRGVIAAAGLRACLQNRWTRYLLGFCWLTALVYVGVLFCLGQLLVADSVVVQWAGGLNPQLQAFVRALTTWLEQHPEISVRVTQGLLFYHFATFLLTPALVAVALAIPHLITRDLASHALVVYASKAVNRFDYLLGKAGVVMGLLTCTWLGPVLAAWLLGNLLAPNWNFFWHARVPLAHVLVFVGTAMAFLSLLALGVSALSGREKATVGLYVVLWLVGGALVPLGEVSRPWLKQLSFQYDLQQWARVVFAPERDLQTAQEEVPLVGQLLREMGRGRRSPWSQPTSESTWPALAVFAGLAAAMVWIRTRPE